MTRILRQYQVCLCAFVLLLISACASTDARRFEETKDQTGEVVRRAHYGAFPDGTECLDGPFWEFKWPLIESGTYVQGKREGPWVQKLISGETAYMEYVNGELEGIMLAAHANGQFAAIGKYKRGKQDGHWRKWNSDGQLRDEEWWRDGERVK